MMNSDPLITVIVIGHNEGERLIRCLNSVRENAYSNIELLYIDSHSSDDSPAKARLLADHVFLAKQRGAAAARNTGLAQAKGDWIMFLDGDTTLAPHFLAQALACLQAQSKLACVWGHRVERYPNQSIYVQVLDLDWRYPPGETAFCGGDALFRREALRQVNGFNPKLLAGEEPEMCFWLRKQGWKIMHLDIPMTQHDLAITQFKQYWQRTSRAGYAYAAVSSLTHTFWVKEVRHNYRQSSALLTLVLLILLGLVTYPLLSAAAFLTLTLLMLRSSWRARWRSTHWPSLLLYGFHSWLAQIPITLGIWRCLRDQATKKRASFANYKATPK
jgi:cellulose synthase/poly-beta-1,6-N-acetylglucosamine synthase-like glycosyltransferase